MSSLLLRFRVLMVFTLLCIVWGSSYLFIRIGVQEISPLALVALRLSIGALTVLAIVIVRRGSIRISRREMISVSILATVNSSTPFLLIAWGETTVPSGLAAVLNSTTPIFALLLAGVVLHDEPITLGRLIGVGTGFIGVIVLLGRDLASGGMWSSLAGPAAIIVASGCYAAGAVFARRNVRGVPAMTIAAYVLLVSAAETLTLSLIFSPPPLMAISAKVWLALLWLGMLGSGVAFICAYFVIAQWGASRYTLVTYVLPVLGLTLGAMFLHESVDWHIAIGTVLVLGGIVRAGLTRPASAASVPARETEPMDGRTPARAIGK